MIANRFVNRFSKKKIVWIQKWHILITLDPLKKNLKFWKMEVIVTTFPKISCLGQITHLGIRMTHLVSQRWIRWKNCFTILHNERVEERHGFILVTFLKKKLFRAIWWFWLKNRMMPSLPWICSQIFINFAH